MENTIILKKSAIYTVNEVMTAIGNSNLRDEQKKTIADDILLLVETYNMGNGMVDYSILNQAACDNGMTIFITEAKEYSKKDIAHVLTNNNIYSQKYKESDVPDAMVVPFNTQINALVDKYPDLDPMTSDDYLGEADDRFYDALVVLTTPHGINLFDQSKLPNGKMHESSIIVTDDMLNAAKDAVKYSVSNNGAMNKLSSSEWAMKNRDWSINDLRAAIAMAKKELGKNFEFGNTFTAPDGTDVTDDELIGKMNESNEDTTTVYSSGLSKKDVSEILEDWKEANIPITSTDEVTKWCKEKSGEYMAPSGVILDIISGKSTNENRNYWADSKSIPESTWKPGTNLIVRNTITGNIEHGVVARDRKKPFYSKRLDSYLMQIGESKTPIYVSRTRLVKEELATSGDISITYEVDVANDMGSYPDSKPEVVAKHVLGTAIEDTPGKSKPIRTDNGELIGGTKYKFTLTGTPADLARFCNMGESEFKAEYLNENNLPKKSISRVKVNEDDDNAMKAFKIKTLASVVKDYVKSKPAKEDEIIALLNKVDSTSSWPNGMVADEHLSEDDVKKIVSAVMSNESKVNEAFSWDDSNFMKDSLGGKGKKMRNKRIIRLNESDADHVGRLKSGLLKYIAGIAKDDSENASYWNSFIGKVNDCDSVDCIKDTIKDMDADAADEIFGEISDGEINEDAVYDVIDQKEAKDVAAGDRIKGNFVETGIGMAIVKTVETTGDGKIKIMYDGFTKPCYYKPDENMDLVGKNKITESVDNGQLVRITRGDTKMGFDGQTFKNGVMAAAQMIKNSQAKPEDFKCYTFNDKTDITDEFITAVKAAVPSGTNESADGIGMLQHIQQEISGGMISSHIGDSDYKTIDAVRSKALSILRKEGDQAYSIENVKALLNRAKTELATTTNEATSRHKIGEKVDVDKNGDKFSGIVKSVGPELSYEIELADGSIRGVDHSHILNDVITEDTEDTFDVKSKSIYHADSEKDAKKYADYINTPDKDGNKSTHEVIPMKHTDDTWHVVDKKDVPQKANEAASYDDIDKWISELFKTSDNTAVRKFKITTPNRYEKIMGILTGRLANKITDIESLEQQIGQDSEIGSILEDDNINESSDDDEMSTIQFAKAYKVKLTQADLEEMGNNTTRTKFKEYFSIPIDADENPDYFYHRDFNPDSLNKLKSIDEDDSGDVGAVMENKIVLISDLKMFKESIANTGVKFGIKSTKTIGNTKVFEMKTSGKTSEMKKIRGVFESTTGYSDKQMENFKSFDLGDFFNPIKPDAAAILNDKNEVYALDLRDGSDYLIDSDKSIEEIQSMIDGADIVFAHEKSVKEMRSFRKAKG